MSDNPSLLSRFSVWQPVSAVAVGVLPIVIFSFTEKSPAKAFVILFIMSGASTLVGALIGFLFGVPKSRTDGVNRGTEERTIVSTEAATDISRRRRYADNANLEEVSDWLTKIIVGLGLVELTRIADIVDPAERLFDPLLERDGTIVLIGCILYFLVFGFIICYIWTRIVFYGILSQADAIRNAVKEEVVKIKEVYDEDFRINKDMNDLYTALDVANKLPATQRDWGLLSPLGDKVKGHFERDKLNRKAAILWARYVAEMLNEVPHGNTRAIRILDDFRYAKESAGQRDRDYADVLYNRVCYCAEIVGGIQDDAEKERFIREALRDLETCLSMFPDIAEIAEHDRDLKPISHLEKFKELVAKAKDVLAKRKGHRQE